LASIFTVDIDLESRSAKPLGSFFRANTRLVGYFSFANPSPHPSVDFISTPATSDPGDQDAEMVQSIHEQFVGEVFELAGS
jgi:hypothetical protein